MENSMNLKDWMEVVSYRISEGSDYLWDVFGENAYSLNYWDEDHDGVSSNIVFDTKTQVVYCLEVCDYKNDRAYRYLNPEFRKQYLKEVKERDVEDVAWNDLYWIDLEDYQDFLQKATAIVRYQPYDTRVSIPLELSDSEMLTLFQMAHERNMTFNDFVEDVILKFVEKEKDSDSIFV
jgi:hypothetical protein